MIKARAKLLKEIQAEPAVAPYIDLMLIGPRPALNELQSNWSNLKPSWNLNISSLKRPKADLLSAGSQCVTK